MKNYKAARLYRIAGVMFGISAVMSLIGRKYTYGFFMLCLCACFIGLSRYYSKDD